MSNFATHAHLKLGAVRSTRAVGTITRSGSRPLTAIGTVAKRAADPDRKNRIDPITRYTVYDRGGKGVNTTGLALFG